MQVIIVKTLPGERVDTKNDEILYSGVGTLNEGTAKFARQQSKAPRNKDCIITRFGREDNDRDYHKNYWRNGLVFGTKHPMPLGKRSAK